MPPGEKFKSFYAEVLGQSEAQQIDALYENLPIKAIRIIPEKFDINRLCELIVENQEEDVEYEIFDDDAVITNDEKLLSFLSHSIEFSAGKFYIQALPAYLVIKYLPLENADYALDACACPGGKGLHCYDRFLRKKPVIMNEPSQARRNKMISVLKIYQADDLPILGIEAGRICRFVVNEIPVIILDVPCSGEAHIISDSQRLKSWRPNQTYQLAKRQYAILSSAIYALKPEGTILYCTCSLSPFENEAVILRALRQFGDAIELMSFPEEFWNIPKIKSSNLRAIEQANDDKFNNEIINYSVRFRPSEFGIPFFACLLRKKRPIYPKREVRQYDIRYSVSNCPKGFSKVIVGAQKEYCVPENWPKLAGLPYLQIGKKT